MPYRCGPWRILSCFYQMQPQYCSGMCTLTQQAICSKDRCTTWDPVAKKTVTDPCCGELVSAQCEKSPVPLNVSGLLEHSICIPWPFGTWHGCSVSSSPFAFPCVNALLSARLEVVLFTDRLACTLQAPSGSDLTLNVWRFGVLKADTVAWLRLLMYRQCSAAESRQRSEHSYLPTIAGSASVGNAVSDTNSLIPTLFSYCPTCNPVNVVGVAG